MVHPVHVGCNNKQSQYPVELQGKPYVTVIKHGRGIQKNLENQYRHYRRTQQCYCRQFDPHGEDNLEGMET